MYYSVCKGIVIFWKYQKFLDKYLEYTQFLRKAFGISCKIANFGLENFFQLTLINKYKYG